MEARAAAIERYHDYMFAEADTSSEESNSDQWDEEEGKRIAAMDDAPPPRRPEVTTREARVGGCPNRARKDWARSSRFQTHDGKR